MSPTFHRRLLGSAAIDAADAQALLRAARALQQGAPQPPAPLQGKNIALLCHSADEPCARRFEAAASALGARVAHIDPAPAWLRDDASLDPQTARLLESLYDAVDCEDLPHAFAQRLQAQLALPVYDGLARDDHPIFSLLPQLAERGPAAGEDARRALLQATLIGSML